MKMTEVVLKDWASFEGEMSRIFEDIESQRAGATGHVSDPLFRGHSNARWRLVTTLERFSKKPHSVAGYYRILLSVLPTVASLTTGSWSLSPDLEVDEGYLGAPPGYEFMIYLRHHGFPSPLLDWSRSPYVAAFFAFAPGLSKSGEDGAIYAFVEHYGSGKIGVKGSPRIIGLGPYATTHERHYAQQSEYTICKKRVGEEFVYCEHEEALNGGANEQDLLTKYIVPAGARATFLHKLDSMNINAYSLFHDVSSLMQTLAYREIERRDL